MAFLSLRDLKHQNIFLFISIVWRFCESHFLIVSSLRIRSVNHRGVYANMRRVLVLSRVVCVSWGRWKIHRLWCCLDVRPPSSAIQANAPPEPETANRVGIDSPSHTVHSSTHTFALDRSQTPKPIYDAHRT